MLPVSNFDNADQVVCVAVSINSSNFVHNFAFSHFGRYKEAMGSGEVVCSVGESVIEML